MSLCFLHLSIKWVCNRIKQGEWNEQCQFCNANVAVITLHRKQDQYDHSEQEIGWFNIFMLIPYNNKNNYNMIFKHYPILCFKGLALDECLWRPEHFLGVCTWCSRAMPLKYAICVWIRSTHTSSFMLHADLEIRLSKQNHIKEGLHGLSQS